jgi:hypothetical protein
MNKLIQSVMKRLIVLALLLAPLPTLAADSGWLSGSCIRGTGTYRWQAGDRYEGQCLNNSFQGRGTLTLYNGDRYEGQFSADQKNGQGIYYFSMAIAMKANFVMVARMVRVRCISPAVNATPGST